MVGPTKLDDTIHSVLSTVVEFIKVAYHHTLYSVYIKT